MIIVDGTKITENFVIAGWPNSAPNRFVPVTYFFLNSNELAVSVAETNEDDIDVKLLLAFLKYHQIIQGNWEVKKIQDTDRIFFPFNFAPFTTLILEKVVN